MDFSIKSAPCSPNSPFNARSRLKTQRWQRLAAKQSAPFPGLGGGSGESIALAGSGPQHFGTRNFDELLTLYPCPVQFYDVLPRCNVDLGDLEQMAVQRLRMLRVIEKVNMLISGKYSAEWMAEVDTQMTADAGEDNLASLFSVKALSLVPLPNVTSVSSSVIQEKKTANMNAMLNRERDHVSHFILRLAYAASDDLRRWFVVHELDLFRYRAARLRDMAITVASVSQQDNAVCTLNDVILANGLEYQGLTLSNIRAESVDQALAVETCALMTQGGVQSASVFYKVPFTEALELVRSRRVHINNGLAYVPDSDMVVLLGSIFRSSLTQSLVLTARILPQLAEDERISSVVSDLSRRYTGLDYGSQEMSEGMLPAVNDERIEVLVKTKPSPFPPCMLALHDSLASTHHLKYKARIQYGLFLKGIGLSLEHAIRFFRGHFTDANGSVSTDKFDKEYVYGIRYNYGKEGKKVNWAPWNCMRIISDSIGAGEQHGCPFKMAEPKALASTLKAGGCSSDAAVAEVLGRICKNLSLSLLFHMVTIVICQ